MLAPLLLTVFIGALAFAENTAAPTPPNVILVMTDDQGYGDLSCHGNPWLKTPAIDALAANSIRLANYHVDPTCAPTRAALMTGRYSSRTGVWHTVMGRSILRKDEVTMAQAFADSGYRTGIFGKWHLGDNYPYRPQDRGFHEVLIHGGGGVGQTPDYWGNDYFDDTYLHNGQYEKFSGYCTDVWFKAAEKFVEQNRDRPFFAYIAPNAPHAPYLVDKKYSAPFRNAGLPSPLAEFYGMIANIDENMARLESTLVRLGMVENTILIFTTDNGTAAGNDGFNVGWRGMKGSEYEGGHRVPCFIRWPAGHFNGDGAVGSLTAHVDFLPTLIDLCRLKRPANVQFDGVSLVPLFNAPVEKTLGRTLFVHSQRIENPEKWRQCAVMTDHWRLVNGKELFEMGPDLEQTHDVALLHPDVMRQLRGEYEKWWADISTRFDEYVRIELGSPQANPTSLTCHDWHAPIEQIPWTHQLIEKSPNANGFWAVDVLRDGRYEITLRDRPAYVAHRLPAGNARVVVGGAEARQAIGADAESVTFTVPLQAGPTTLQTWLELKDGKSRGAYFVDVKFVE
ncbi:MAG: arylsulfatase [Planctomycetaceae bacterium]